jgi:hypothetical protein
MVDIWDILKTCFMLCLCGFEEREYFRFLEVTH